MGRIDRQLRRLGNLPRPQATTHAVCPLCDRQCPRERMSRHHLKTRKVHRWETELICNDCHAHIHAFFENKELAENLHTIEALKQHPDFAKALNFLRKQAPESKSRVKSKTKR